MSFLAAFNFLGLWACHKLNILALGMEHVPFSLLKPLIWICLYGHFGLFVPIAVWRNQSIGLLLSNSALNGEWEAMFGYQKCLEILENFGNLFEIRFLENREKNLNKNLFQNRYCIGICESE